MLSCTTPSGRAPSAPCRKPLRLWVPAGSPGRAASARVYAFDCPWSALGLQPGADAHAVKAAYRRLAKKYHPDVLQSQQHHQLQQDGVLASGTSLQFLNISEAYGFLMQQMRSGGADSHGDDADGAAARQGNSAAFHDWYWSFRMRRTWQRQQSAKQHGAAASGPASHRAPSAEADLVEEDPCGCSDSGPTVPGGGMGMNGGAAAAGVHGSRPQDAESLRSQLAGLRHRAAIRKNRPTTPAAASDQANAAAAAAAAGGGAESAATAHPAFRPSEACFAAMDGPSDSADPPPSVVILEGQAGAVGADAGVGGIRAVRQDLMEAAAVAPAFEVQQHTVPEPQPGVPQQHVAWAQEGTPVSDPGGSTHALPEPPPPPHAGATRRRFVSTSAVRDALREQLTGMRRKAVLREQLGGGDTRAAAAEPAVPATRTAA